MTTFFSIITPTYNCSFISRAISSVLKQTFSSWELIVIDNFSKNSTEEIIKKYNDKRIKYYKFNNQGIIAKSRNYGIKLSTTEWIAFLDSDDFWEKNKLEICFQNIKKYDHDLYYHGLYQAKEGLNLFKKKIADKSRLIVKPIFENLLINGNAIGNSSVVVKKSILYKINLISEDKNKYSWEDFDTWLRISQITEKFFFINKILGYYWIGKGRVTNPAQIIKNYQLFKKYYGFFLKKNFRNINRFYWIDYYFAVVNFKKKKYKSSYILSKNIKINLSKIGLIVLIIRIFFLKSRINILLINSLNFLNK